MRIAVKRVYDAPVRSDGQRVLVDRVWPRGVTKEALHHDAWMKAVAPSAGLRKWFGHDPAKWDRFRDRYFKELDAQPDVVEELLARCRQGTVTLLFAAKDQEHNNAVALKSYLERHIKRGQGLQ